MAGKNSYAELHYVTARTNKPLFFSGTPFGIKLNLNQIFPGHVLRPAARESRPPRT